MAETCLCLQDNLFASDAARITVGMVFAGARATVGDAARINRQLHLADAISISDTGALTPTIIAGDRLAIADTCHVTMHSGVMRGDTLSITDHAVLPYRVFCADVVTAREAVTIVRTLVATESLTIGDQASALFEHRIKVQEELTISAGATVRPQMVFAEALHIGDTGSIHGALNCRDTAALSDRAAVMATTSLLAQELAALSDGVTFRQQMSLLVEDQAYIWDEPLLPPSGVAWTANTDSWAASRYAGFTLNSLAVINGVLYGAGDAGLYRIDGSTDVGAAIAASFTTGQHTNRDDSMRRGGYVYTTMQTDGEMQVQVLDVQAGVPTENTYPFESRPAQAPTPTRAKLGKGLRSLLWQFQVSNVNGADFQIPAGMKWLAAPGSRRV
jgi:predicted acyltransferase (DUF342 family)